MIREDKSKMKSKTKTSEDAHRQSRRLRRKIVIKKATKAKTFTQSPILGGCTLERCMCYVLCSSFFASVMYKREYLLFICLIVRRLRLRVRVRVRVGVEVS
jgi:hypothetical protein